LWTTDDYDLFFQSPVWSHGFIDRQGAIEESFFLGLRLNRGIDSQELREKFGADLGPYDNVMNDLLSEKLLEQSGGKIGLSARGRLLSNEVFQKFLLDRDPRKLGKESLFYRPIEAEKEKI
jgi:coproporphyrinogen III oxidase-like Fe-S oxidoreductase